MRLTSLPLLLTASACLAQDQKIKNGLYEEDWRYTLAPGVVTREVTYYSDGVPCYAKLFFPKGFSVRSKTPAIVLGQGWAGQQIAHGSPSPASCEGRSGQSGSRRSRELTAMARSTAIDRVQCTALIRRSRANKPVSPGCWPVSSSEPANKARTTE